MSTLSWWDMINSTWIKWMTTTNSFNHQPTSFQTAMSLDSFNGVLRTGWIKTTISADEHTQRLLIDSDKAD